MYYVSEKTRELYRKDVPEVKRIPRKQLILNFENGIKIENERIHGGSFFFEESICNESDIKFGGCIASCLKIKIAGLDKDISGVRFSATHKIDGGDDIPYGNFTVDSAKLTNDMQHREIVAYDDIYGKLNQDVIGWYKSLAFPLALKVFRQSLFSYVGIPIEEQELVNDGMTVEKTIDANYLNGIDVAKAIGEINGTFGLIGRGGKFKYIVLDSMGLYPAEDLFPSEDLFPAEATEQFGRTGYRETKYEEYQTDPIDCLKIRQQDGDVGAHSPQMGKWENPYIITGNFLVYGKTAAQLQEICDNIFSVIKGISYRPHTTKLNGLPYIEPGDSFTLEKKKNSIESFVFSRTITGSQALVDTWTANGNMYLKNEVSTNTEIEMLKGKSMIIQKSVEGLKVVVSDLEADTNSKFEQTANRITAEVASINKDMTSRFEITNNAITAEVKRATDEEEKLSGRIDVTARDITLEVNRATKAEGNLSSRISVTEKNIELKVDKSGVISAINISPENIRIQGKKIQLDGEVTFNNSNPLVLSPGTTTINGGCIKTGTIDASVANITNINASNINTGSFNANLIKAGTLDASKITVENLVVGENVTMGKNATISWSNVTGKGDVAYIDDIPDDDYITRITENTITTGYINALGITAKYVEAEGIKAGTISGVSLEFTEGNSVFWTTADNTWTCDSNAIYSDGRYIQLYANNGDAHFEGTTYTYEVQATDVRADTGRFYEWCYSPDWTNGSDRRIKNTINYEDNERMSKIIDYLDPVTYYMNNDKKKKLRFGFIAQDVKRVIDNMYGGEQALYSQSEEDGIYSLSYNDIIAPLVAKVQYMQKEIKELRKTVINQGGTE